MKTVQTKTTDQVLKGLYFSERRGPVQIKGRIMTVIDGEGVQEGAGAAGGPGTGSQNQRETSLQGFRE